MADCTQTITRTVATTPPTITCPATVNLPGCNPAVPAPDPSSVTATDACGTPTVTFGRDAVSITGWTETATRTYHAKDGCRNTAQCPQTVTRPVDRSRPPTR